MAHLMASGALSPKIVSLFLLTFQNSALILMMHYSRIMPLADGQQRYLPSTAVLISELLKLSISLTAAICDLARKHPSLPVASLLAPLSSGIFSSDSWKMAVPASLYVAQNTLQYIGCSNLDASVFQITYQLKVLTTAVFSVLLLGRRLSGRKWLSLLLLTVGVALVQAPSGSKSVHTTETQKENQSTTLDLRSEPEDMDESAALQAPHMNATLGLAAVLVACFFSGLAGVFFEKVLKEYNAKSSSGSKPQISVWERNIQLSFYSLFPALFIGVMYNDGEQIARHGFFAGYNSAVWTTIGLQAVGGVIVALVINYSNNIGKGFATSISIVVSVIASMILFDLSLSFNYILGILVVLGATWLYNMPDQPRGPSLVIEDYEKQEAPKTPRSYDLFSDDPKSSSLQPHGSESFSTSRPGTPGTERHHFRVWSARKQFDKREA